MEIAETFKRAYVYKPRLDALEAKELQPWRYTRLRTSEEERLDDFHALMDEQYAQLETDFIRHDIYSFHEEESNLKSFMDMHSSGDDENINFIHLHSWESDLSTLSKIFWETCSVETNMDVRNVISAKVLLYTCLFTFSANLIFMF